ncbi:MAG: diguanylate cyclase [Nitrospinae bacterium]|nr:diguanylate cyclase [Nitrospinota bacterium]
MVEEKQVIIVADDEKSNRVLLNELLKDRYRIILAKDGKQALARAQEFLPDLILLDVIMPVMDGHETIKMLKNDDKTRNIPVIFISGLDSTEDEQTGLDLGAADYISKPFHPAIVEARVRNHLRSVRQRRLLERLAHIDGLTEIPNRRSFEQSLEKEWFRCMRSKAPVSIIMVDVDYFKLYNDHYGHTAGDCVLRKVALGLSKSLNRSCDIVARYGGEEFVALLPDTEIDGGKMIAEAMRATVESLDLTHCKSNIFEKVTISIGGATEIPPSESFGEKLLNKADQMLYKAKETGRNRVVWYEE